MHWMTFEEQQDSYYCVPDVSPPCLIGGPTWNIICCQNLGTARYKEGVRPPGCVVRRFRRYSSCGNSTRFNRDPLFTAKFLETLRICGMPSLILPLCSLNLTAHAERLLKTLNESCPEQLILTGEWVAGQCNYQFIDHFHHERNIQGLNNWLIMQGEPSGGVTSIKYHGTRTPLSARTRPRERT